jgi:hypothetical protein
MNTRTAHEHSRIEFSTVILAGAALFVSCNTTLELHASKPVNSSTQIHPEKQATLHRDVSPAPGLKEVSPISDRILMLRFVNGRAFHATAAGGGADGYIETIPFNVKKATASGSYRVFSRNDATYAKPMTPLKVGRKAKALISSTINISSSG